MVPDEVRCVSGKFSLKTPGSASLQDYPSKLKHKACLQPCLQEQVRVSSAEVTGAVSCSNLVSSGRCCGTVLAFS